MIDDENAPGGVPLGKPLEEAAVQEFAAGFRGELIRRGDEGYDDARGVFNAMIDRHPALIARCTGVADVIAAVNLAREQDLVIAVRGGGHSAPGYGVCEGGIVIDLSPMKGIWVDPETRTARAQGGVTWASASALAAVPVGTRNTATSFSKISAKRCSTRPVHSSLP